VRCVPENTTIQPTKGIIRKPIPAQPCGVELKLFDDENKELSSNSEFIVGQVIYSLLHEILFCWTGLSQNF
jgi:hypothetical protein